MKKEQYRGQRHYKVSLRHTEYPLAGGLCAFFILKKTKEKVL